MPLNIPTITVVLPCYNAESLIGKAIDSIVKQSYKDWELIVVDDASTDSSVERVKTFKDKRIKLIQLATNGGYPIAMNEGIAQATGEYIARMDADDVCLPDRFKQQLIALEQNTKASFCGTNRFRITPGGKMYIDRVRSNEKLKWESWQDLIGGKRLFTDASVILRRDFVMAVGGYRTYQRSGMDVDLWLRVMEKFGPGITLMKPLYGRVVEPNSLIFNPKTYLINQVPRVLARQRTEYGQDDVQRGVGIKLDEYIAKGWVSVQPENQSGLFYGSLVTCLWLRDWTGARIFWSQLSRSSNGNYLTRLKMMFVIFKKIMQRVRSNPFQEYHEK